MAKDLKINDKLIAKYELSDDSKPHNILFLKVYVDIYGNMNKTELMCYKLIEFIENRKFSSLAYLNIQ